MSYLLMIVEGRGTRGERTREEGEDAFKQMLRYGESLKTRNLLLASESLTSDAHGVRVKLRDGRKSLVDGPFAESKEFIGGFFLIDCKTRDEAIAIAAECPAAAWATVEVREVGPCFAS